MRKLLLIGVTCGVLVACNSAEKDARRLLTSGQAHAAAGRYVEALAAFDAVAKQYPETSSATEALRESKPLAAERFAVILACVTYNQDTGLNLVDGKDLFLKPSLVDDWKGPYVTVEQWHHFGKWIGDVGCRHEE